MRGTSTYKYQIPLRRSKVPTNSKIQKKTTENLHKTVANTVTMDATANDVAGAQYPSYDEDEGVLA